MNIKLFGYSISLNVIILIGIFYLIMVVNALSGSCNREGLMSSQLFKKDENKSDQQAMETDLRPAQQDAALQQAVKYKYLPFKGGPTNMISDQVTNAQQGNPTDQALINANNWARGQSELSDALKAADRQAEVARRSAANRKSRAQKAAAGLQAAAAQQAVMAQQAVADASRQALLAQQAVDNADEQFAIANSLP